MNKNQKGLSTIVTTLIIVLLVLVAIAIVWGVVLPLFQGGEEEIESGGNALLYNCGSDQVGGEICNVSAECDGSVITSKDSTMCCPSSANCVYKSCTDLGGEVCSGTTPTCASGEEITSADANCCTVGECTAA